MRGALFLLLLAGGCGEEPAPSPCESETRGQVLSVGDEFEGQALDAEILSMQPAPPQVGLNTWSVDLGETAEGCTLEASPWMPDHGHGAEVGESIQLDDGGWVINDLRFSMGGIWEVELTLTCGEQASTVTVALCVEA